MFFKPFLRGSFYSDGLRIFTQKMVFQRCLSSNPFNTLATWCKELTHWKRPCAGKDWRQEEKRAAEDEMVGWHQPLNGCEFEQAPGDSEWQGSLVYCGPWDCKELDTTERLNWNNVYHNLKVWSIVKTKY